MANSFVTYQGLGAVANRCLMRLHNNCAIASRVTRDWDDQYGQRRRKIGDTFYIRKPPRYTLQTSADITSVLEDYTDPTPASIVLNQRIVVPISIPDSDWLLKFDEADERFFDPAMEQMGNQLDRYLAQIIYQGSGNTVGSGGTVTDTTVVSRYAPVPGTALTGTSTTSAYEAFLGAKARLRTLGYGRPGAVAILDPYIEAKLLSMLTGVNAAASPTLAMTGAPGNPSLAKMFAKGKISDMAGLEWFVDENLYTHTSGTTAAAALVNGTVVSGTASIVSDGWTNTTGSLKAGDCVQFGGTASASGGTYGVNPMTRQTYGELAQFVVTADATADGSGNMTFTVSPTPYYSATTTAAGALLQNVTAMPVDNAYIYLFGAHANTYASKTFNMSLVYHPDAVGMASVKLPDYEQVWRSASAVDEETGLSIRVAQFVDGLKSNFIMRADALFGATALESAGIVRVQTT